MQAYRNDWVECASQVPNCDVSILGRSAAGAQLDVLVDVMVGLNTNGSSISNLESYRSQLENFDVAGDGQSAQVTECTEDNLILTDREGNVINDAWVSTRTVWTFELIDGVWKVTTGFGLGSAQGPENTLCSF